MTSTSQRGAVERMLPLYEGKMGHQYDHRAATFTGLGDTDLEPNGGHAFSSVVMPRYWVRESVAADRIARRRSGTELALLGFRRVARNTDERTVNAPLLPFGAASYGWILSAGPDARSLALMLAQYNSFAFDFLLRQFPSQPSIPQRTFEQLPTLTCEVLSKHDRWFGDAQEWITRRALFLSVTGAEVAGFAEELGRQAAEWDERRRTPTRCELDGAFFHFFGIARDDVDYIMDAFPIVKRKDEAAYGEYRTKRLILETYDATAEAISAGTPYTSPFDEE